MLEENKNENKTNAIFFKDGQVEMMMMMMMMMVIEMSMMM